VQSCVAPCEQRAYEPFGQSRRAFEKNTEFLDMARDAGVTIAGTCSPYLTGWLPVRGEHFVTTESGVTVIGNSIFAAMGNSDGIEAAFWSAVCGRTPLWGNHVPENRGGTHVVRIDAEIGAVIEWELLGCAVGRRLPTAAKPVIDGRFDAVTFQELRRFCTTLAISSSCELCHIPGITPEARTVDDAMHGRPPVETPPIDACELARVYESICDAGEGPIDFVSLGCPHYDIDQIKHAAMYLRGKTISPNVHFMIWTAYPIKHMADLNGYTETIESAGGHIYSSSCPGSVGSVFVDGYTGFVFDSLKKADSVKSMVDSPVYYTDYRRCIDAAVTGVWKEEYRWASDRA
jgi:predicted aconitase